MKSATFEPAYFRKDTTSRDRWMVSYLDVLTILLILFVAAAAQSRRQQAAAAAVAVPPVVGHTPVSRASTPVPEPSFPADPVLRNLLDQLKKKGLDARSEPRGVVIALPQTLLFPPGDDHLMASALPALGDVAQILGGVPNKIGLVGHADAAPVHNRRFADNWELAAARGLRILNLLTHRFEIPEARLSMESDGSFEPRGPNDTPDGRAANRRVEIVIFPAAEPTRDPASHPAIP